MPQERTAPEQTREGAPEQGPRRESQQAGQARPESGTQPVATRINASTVMYSTPGRSGYRAEKSISPRATVVVTQQAGSRSGKPVIQAYRQTLSSDGRVTTRVYSDGTRTVQGPGFTSRGVTGSTQLVHYSNGLHAAYTSGGRAIYSEAFVPHGGVPGNQLIQRTVYATTVRGVFIPLPHPIYHYYSLVAVGGFATYVYEPVVYAPAFFVPLYAPFGAAVIVGPACVLCPVTTVVFAQPVVQYADPMVLLGDQQIADAAAGAAPEDQAQPPPPETGDPQTDSGQVIAPDGDVAPAPAPVVQSEPAPPPALLQDDTAPSTSAAPQVLASLNSQAQQVTGEISAHVKNAVAITEDNEVPPAAASADTAAEPESVLPLNISEDIRQQIHKQVRLSVAQHANHHEQSLASILSSDYSHIYLFQVDEPLQVSDVTSGAGCTLGEGELLRVDDAQDPQAVSVRVIASRAGHCSVGDAVQVSAGALQDMLNTFNLRIECNMRKMRRAMTTLST